jgi:hypothetical protein
MDFRVNLTIEVDQVGNGLAIQTPIAVQLIREAGHWHAECASPGVRSEAFTTMEEALVAAADQVAAEVQAAVIERPLVVGKITPDKIPAGMF